MRKIPVRQIQEPSLADHFNIKAIEALLNGGEMVQELHGHDFFYLLVLKKGIGKHEIDFTRYEVGDSMLFFMRPGQVHQLNLKPGSTGYLLQFKPDLFDVQDHSAVQLLRQASRQNFCKTDANQFDKLDKILTYIFKEFTDRQEGYLEVIKAGMHVFFIELLRHRQNKQRPIKGASLYTQEKLEQFVELLERKFTTDKRVDQYAGLMNLSTYQLAAITKNLLNKTPSELINEYIILEAKRQLLATSSQVSQIAYYLGYEDISYFIRFFKKHTGASPEAFRKNFK
ncbi:helix-turn-helix domain-containing protein [Pedobacter panaciterrae]|uniref:AraC family transcriptional regulator n=1 Tax=Pedobacter panaciterrae TaxID=363849 RepID=UPI00155DACBF|nr:AraC family transcriptional regulator [Pedobacter panaciterrae]NQX56916.1 helix-turn-helix domain-containing protein [Pedobacter panaciterrae]